MKRRLTVLLVSVGMMMFSLVPAASADPGECDTGREYAQEHIVPLAQDGTLGQGHKPGAEHQGFSNVPAVCAHDD